MLKVKSFWLILFSLFITSSCSKDSDENQLLVSMNIDGQEWNTEIVEGSNPVENEYIVSASDDYNGKTLSIEFNIILADNEDMEFTLGPKGEADINVSIDNEAYSTTNFGSSGILTLTELTNSRIEGTFRLTAYQSYTEDPQVIEITNGILKASFLPY